MRKQKAVDLSVALHHNKKKARRRKAMQDTRADFQECLDATAGILIRCFLGGMALLIIWFAGYAAAGDWIYQVHTRWFQIPRQTFDAIHYTGMAVTKIAIILFFLLPWIAIQLISGKKRE